MPQLSLYLDEETMDSLRKSAAARGVSLSRCASDAIRGNAAAWPAGFWNLYGAVADSSFARPQEPPFELDAVRRTFE